MINLLVIVFILFGIKSILLSKNGIENSIQWIIFAFVLGYRTFEPVAGLKIHPIEIFIYLSIFRALLFKPIKYTKIPKVISILGVLFLTMYLIDIFTRYNPIVLLEFKNAILLYMVFYMVQFIQINDSLFIKYMKTYLFSATFISFLGILEYLFPSFIASIFGFDHIYNFNLESIFFSRLAFLFWGSHLAANLIAPVFPIMILLKYVKDPILKNNIILTGFILLNLFAIYLSGNRISWLILTAMLILTLFQFRKSLIPRLKPFILFISVGFIAYVYSQPVEGRYISTFKALTGQIDTKYDSSGGERMARAKMAMSSIMNNPIGTGWGSQGWVHSDVLQIGASVGIISALIFFFSPIVLFIQIFRYYKDAPPDLSILYFCQCNLLIFVIISFLLNGNILKVQSGVPLIVLWALVEGFRQYNRDQYRVLAYG